MGEEGSNVNKTESEPQILDSVPEELEHSPVQKKEESEKLDPSNAVVNQQEPNEQVTSPLVQNAGLARVVAEKRLALIKAWEESEKTKAENRAYKKLSAVGSWEESRKASIEAQLKKIEEDLERKKAEYVEKMRNKIAEIHQSAEERRAIVEAQKREEFLEVEDTAAKFRSRGVTPRKFFACFSG